MKKFLKKYLFAVLMAAFLLVHSIIGYYIFDVDIWIIGLFDVIAIVFFIGLDKLTDVKKDKEIVPGKKCCSITNDKSFWCQDIIMVNVTCCYDNKKDFPLQILSMYLPRKIELRITDFKLLSFDHMKVAIISIGREKFLYCSGLHGVAEHVFNEITGAINEYEDILVCKHENNIGM